MKRTKTRKTGSASVTKNVLHKINSTVLPKISVLKSYTIILVIKTKHTKCTVNILVQMPTFVSLYLGFSVKIILVSLLALPFFFHREYMVIANIERAQTP